MHAELFYTIESVHPVPLYLISQKQWEKLSSMLTTIERNYFIQAQFNGKIGEYCLLYNADGLLEKAYVGTEDENQALAMAHAALLLPANSYQLQGTCSQEAALFWGLAQYRFEKYKKIV